MGNRFLSLTTGSIQGFPGLPVLMATSWCGIFPGDRRYDSFHVSDEAAGATVFKNSICHGVIAWLRDGRHGQKLPGFGISTALTNLHLIAVYIGTPHVCCRAGKAGPPPPGAGTPSPGATAGV
jgi:hypothetical protein